MLLRVCWFGAEPAPFMSGSRTGSLPLPAGSALAEKWRPLRCSCRDRLGARRPRVTATAATIVCAHATLLPLPIELCRRYDADRFRSSGNAQGGLAIGAAPEPV